MWTHSSEDFAPRIRSYVKDNTHFLNILKHLKIQSTDLLVTIDVKSLYTNIPHTEGIAAITKMVEDTGLDTLLRMFICNLSHQVLTKNYFIFNKQLYIQKQGTAMGTRMAPNYAIIFMHYLESNFLETTTRKPKIWLRFIDDIFMIWSHGLQELKNLMDRINNYHPSIKFTYDKHREEILFLDTIVYRARNNKLFTRNYHKPSIINNTKMTTQFIPENRKSQSLMAYQLEVKGYQNRNTLNKKQEKYYNN